MTNASPKFRVRGHDYTFNDVEDAIRYGKKQRHTVEIVLEGGTDPVCWIEGDRLFVTMFGQPYVSTVPHVYRGSRRK